MTGLEVPESHPRHESLLTRHRIEDGVDLGITSKQGLIAQGRGEAFDYLLGEETIPSADAAERAAVAHLLRADRPVISVNGNVAALAPGETVQLAQAIGADIEINLFNRTNERIERIADHLREHGAENIKGLTADGRIPGLEHERAKVDADGSGRPTLSSSRSKTATGRPRSPRWVRPNSSSISIRSRDRHGRRRSRSSTICSGRCPT